MKSKLDIRIRFGKKIKDIRESKGISQEELADCCGLDRTYISGVELGKRNISLLNIEKISKALEIYLSEIFKEL